MSIPTLHIGHKNAFHGWKLIWTDNKGKTHIKAIPEKTAKALMRSGMSLEG